MVKEWGQFVNFLRPWTIGIYPAESLQACIQYILSSMLNKEFSIENNVCSKDGTNLVIWYGTGNNGKAVSKKPVLAVRLNDLNELLAEDMKRLGCCVGMTIGKNIKLYYSSKKLNKTICVCNIEIESKDPNGNRLFSLLASEKFVYSSLVDYFEELFRKVNPKELIDNILEPYIFNPSIKIKSILKKELEAKGFRNDLIYESLKEIKFKVEYKGKIYPEAKDIQFEILSSQISHDTTKFSIDGVNFYSKRNFVLEVVKQYVKEHPEITYEITYEELNTIFRSDVISKIRGVVRPLEIVKKWIQESPDLKKRYFLDDNEIITLCNGEKVVVNNQWGKNTFPKFLRLIEKYYTIHSNREYSEYPLSSSERNEDCVEDTTKEQTKGINISLGSLQNFKKRMK